MFRYTVLAGDTDTDGIASASPINLNGGTIKDTAAAGRTTPVGTARFASERGGNQDRWENFREGENQVGRFFRQSCRVTAHSKRSLNGGNMPSGLQVC